MTLRVRLLSLMLSMVGVVAVTLTALNVNSLAVTSVDGAILNSEEAGRQVQSFLLRRLAEDAAGTAAPSSTAEAKRLWSSRVANDADINALLEQVMAQSRSIVEVDIAGEDGVTLASSNPRQAGMPMISRQNLRSLKDASPLGRIVAMLTARNDYETLQHLGIAGQNTAVLTIQILASPVFLRDALLPEFRTTAIASGLALALAFAVAYWSS